MDPHEVLSSGIEVSMERITFLQDYMKIEGHFSSKGNQWKWNDGAFWYKADQLGCEALTETVVSHLLLHSTIQNHVIYEPVMINYHGKELLGCRSRNFLKSSEELITLERLFRQNAGMSLAKEISYFSDIKKRIEYTVDHVINYTGLVDFGKYLTQMLEMDAFFLNEDRHTNNIAVIYDLKSREYRYCPYFDMGLSLFADLKQDFPIEKSFEECRKEIIAKPFARDFDEQMDAANELYGSYLRFEISKEKMVKEIAQWELPYEEKVIQRVTDTLRYQAGKYLYMMK